MNKSIIIPSRLASVVRQSLICREYELMNNIKTLSHVEDDFASRLIVEYKDELINIKKVLALV